MENTVLGMIEKALNGNGGTNGAYRNNEGELVHIYEISGTRFSDFTRGDFEWADYFSNNKDFIERLNKEFDTPFTNIKVSLTAADELNFKMPTIDIKFTIKESGYLVDRKAIADNGISPIIDEIEEVADEYISEYLDGDTYSIKTFNIKSLLHRDLSSIKIGILKDYIEDHMGVYGFDPNMDEMCGDYDEKTYIEIKVEEITKGKVNEGYDQYLDVVIQVRFEVIEGEKILDFVNDDLLNKVSSKIAAIEPAIFSGDTITVLTNFDNKFKSIPKYIMCKYFKERVELMVNKENLPIGDNFYVNLDLFKTNPRTIAETGNYDGMEIKFIKKTIWNV